MGAFDGISNWVKSQWHGYDVAAQKKKDEENKRATSRLELQAVNRAKTPQQRAQATQNIVRNNRPEPIETRSTAEQIINPFIGSVTSMATKLPANVGSFVGNAMQDPFGTVKELYKPMYNPVGYVLDSSNRFIKSQGGQTIFNPYSRIDNATSAPIQRTVQNATPQGVKDFGKSIEDVSARSATNIDRNIANSRFTTQAKPGENKFVTNLSSGGGSLASSLALRTLPGGSFVPAVTFGVNAGGEQIRNARASGASNAEAFSIGTQAGVLEAGLEKAGLDKFLENFGGSSVIKNTVKNAIIEGTQEATQSLAQAGITGQYQQVNAQQVIAEALMEGLYGGILGGGSTAIATTTQKLQQQGIPYDQAKKIATDTYNKIKTTAQNNSITGIALKNISNGQLTRNDLSLLSDYADYRNGRYNPGTDLNNLITEASAVANRIGLDLRTGSPAEINQRIGDFLSNVDAKLQAQLQGGFIAGPLALDFSKNKDQGRVFEGVDGKPRFEVSDDKSKIKIGKVGKAWDFANVDINSSRTSKTLGEVLEHTKLYENYPELKNVLVKELPEGSQRGHYNPATNEIFIDSSKLDTPDKLREGILHELTHYIQEKEGFATGANLQSASGMSAKEVSQINQVRSLIEQVKDSATPLYDIGRSNAPKDVKDWAMNLIRGGDDAIADFNKNTPYELYRRHLGEAEARAVANRMNMTDGERYKMPKSASEYGMSHRPDPEGARVFNMTETDQVGKDYYQHPEWYGANLRESWDKESWNVIQRIKDKPNAEVTVYRAAPKNELNSGDWVSFSKDYADMHVRETGEKVYTHKVKAKDLRFAGDSINEFGYYPEVKPKSTFYDSLDVPKEDLIIRDGTGKAMSVERPKDVPSYIPDDKIDAYLKSDDYKRDKRFAKMAAETKSGDPFDNPDMYTGEIDERFKPDGKAMSVDKPKRSQLSNFENPQKLDSNTLDKALENVGDNATEQQLVKEYNKLQRRGLSGKALDVPSASLDKNGTVKTSPQQTVQVQTSPSSTLNTQQEGKLKVATTPKNQYPAFSTKESPNAPSISSSKDIGNMLMAADNGEFTNQDAEMQPDWEAPARNPKSNSTRKLVEQIGNDNKLTEMAREAQMNGEQLNFYAKKDADGRSVGIEQFDPESMRIEAGFVIDNNTEKVLGNHIRVDETGISVNVGGREVNTDSIVGNPQDWEGNYRVTETMDRNLKRLAPNEQIYKKTRDFVIGHKTKQEASFREELRAERQSLRERAKTVNNARPRGVSKTEYKADIFDYIEGNKKKSELNKKYDKNTVAQIEQYKKDTRAIYDKLLDRVNEVYARFGEEQVPRRQNYLTHINELMNKPSFAGELYGRLQNSFLGEGQQTTRGAVPANIEGRTENFKPSKKWNRFFQQRKGGEFTKDPFVAVDAYLEPTLYNIYMTESAVRARALEATFRTAEEVRQMDKKYLQENLVEELQKYAKSENKGWTAGLAEYANALTGKTQRLDRQVIDMSPASSAALRGWQQLQRVGGRATVLANASSIVSQSLNQPLAISDAGVINYTKGLVKGIAGKTPIDQSPFIRARQTNVASPYRSNFDKTTDVLGVPLQVVELAFVKQTWNAEYEAAVSDGFKGQEAIMEADRRTEQVVAGRGLADKPEVYRSTVTNGLLQYTLEVSATNKKFLQDLNTAQKAEFMAATWAMNNLVGLITGFEPLPDFLDAAIESITSFFDSEDERSTKDKVIGSAQRFAGETVSMNPQATAIANTVLSPEDRKTWFGENSDVARFEGTAAPIKVIQNANSALQSANKAINAETPEEQQGRTLDATKNFLKILPAGNQAQKTLTGVLMNQRGYNIDSSGNPTYAAPDNPLGKTQAAVFGPYSTKEARAYFDNNGSSISGKSDQASIKTSANPRDTVNSIQTSKAETKSGVTTTPEGTIKISGVTEKNSSGDYTSMDKYKAVQYLQNLQDGEMNNIQKFDNKELKQAIKEVSDEGKLELTNRNIPTDNIKFDSKFAKEYANFKDSIANTNAIDKADKTNTFLTTTVKSQLSDIEKEIYGLSEEDLISYYEGGTINDQNVENALRVERILYDAGLIDKEQLARKLDLDARGYKSKKGSKGKTALNKAISFATPSGSNLPAFSLSSGRAPSAKLSIPSVRTASSSPKGRQYTVSTKKLG